MAAFNWILVDHRCPGCAGEATLKCQTHAASDYDGDDRGRFHDRVYRLGEFMNWWPADDPRYPSWRVNGRRAGPLDGEVDYDCCYSKCQRCAAELYVVLEFRKQAVVRVIEIGPEQNWPAGYWR